MYKMDILYCFIYSFPSFVQITKPALFSDKPQSEGHVACREPVTANAQISDRRRRADRREGADLLFTAPAAFSKPW